MIGILLSPWGLESGFTTSSSLGTALLVLGCHAADRSRLHRVRQAAALRSGENGQALSHRQD